MKKNEKMTYEDILFPLNDTDKLHMVRISKDKKGPPVLMLHGSIENNRVFYSENGKGLAPYLASYGYDVFAANMRGRGKGEPSISKDSSFGQTEEIIEDIPAFMNKIIEIKGDVKQYWIAHSWGGVLMSSHLARAPWHVDHVQAMVYFGSKRYVNAINFTRLFQIDLFWRWICRIIALRKGYLDGSKLPLNVGSDKETIKTHLHCKLWATRDKWIDPDDGFDYGQAIKNVKLPPILYFAAANDRCLGHPKDVIRFVKESKQENHKYILLSKKNGNLHNYDHISMLTHTDAVNDHFPFVLKWLRKH